MGLRLLWLVTSRSKFIVTFDLWDICRKNTCALRSVIAEAILSELCSNSITKLSNFQLCILLAYG